MTSNSNEITVTSTTVTTRYRACAEDPEPEGIWMTNVVGYSSVISITSSSVLRHSGKSAGSQAVKPGSAKRRSSPG